MAVVELVVKMLLVKRGGPALHEPTVAALMQSMADVGLVNPITVWRPTGVMPEVIAGRHRLEAAKRLGWEDIACNVLEQLTEEPTAEAIEVVENLHRRDLPKAEKDKLIRRYVELSDARKAKEVSGTEFPKPSSNKGGRPRGSASTVAASIGLTKRAVNKAVERDKAREAGEPAKASSNRSSIRSRLGNDAEWPRKLERYVEMAPNDGLKEALRHTATLSSSDRAWLRAHLS